MLSCYAEGDFLQKHLKQGFQLYPDITGRDFWNGMVETHAQKYTQEADRLLGKEQRILPASKYLLFTREGDRSQYEGAYFQRRGDLHTLLLAECMANTGKYLDAALDLIWAICGETAWCVPAHVHAPLPDPDAPVVDLFAAETAATLAAAWHLLGPAFGEPEAAPTAKMIRHCVHGRIFEPFMKNNNYNWMTRPRPNNWNPWINSNVLFAALTLEEDMNRKIGIVKRSIRSIDNFIEGYVAEAPDGGCDEGPVYWTVAAARMHDFLEMLMIATGGAINIYGEPLIKAMGDYICKAHISGNALVNFADSSAKGEGPGGAGWYYGKYTGNQSLMDYAATSLQDVGLPGYRINPHIKGMMAAREARGNPGTCPLYRDSYLRGIQVMAARQAGGSDRGLYLAAKGGHNGESHNHNDVGSFIVYMDGQPVLIDAGVGTYTKQTFSPGRYGIWTMQSAWHNLPTVGGVMQRNGREFAAKNASYDATGGITRFSLDIAGAYPAEAGIVTWVREFTFDRARECITLREVFALAGESGDIRFTLLTPCEPACGPGEIQLGGAWLEYPGDLLSCAVEAVEVTDQRLQSIWGGRLYRVVLRYRESVGQGNFTLRIGV